MNCFTSNDTSRGSVLTLALIVSLRVVIDKTVACWSTHESFCDMKLTMYVTYWFLLS